jgi:hypothetical protein
VPSKASSFSAHVRESDLAALTRLSIVALRRVLSGIKPVRRARDPRYRWRDVLPLLTADRLVRTRVRPHSWLADYPQLRREWHPTRNDVHADALSPGSGRKIWWLCAKGHEWRVAIYTRTAQRTGCPYCSGHRVAPERSLAALRPGVAREWHRDRNGALTPRAVTVMSNRRVWWRCGDHPEHEWRAAVDDRATGSGCPFCSGRRVWSGYNLARCFPAVAAEWNRRRNGGRGPDSVHPSSSRRVWWRCARGHEWRASIAERTRRGSGCAECSLTLRGMAHGTLAEAHPGVAREWCFERNEQLTPDDVGPRSAKRVWWTCRRNRKHEWRASVAARTVGAGCPYCAGHRFPESESLATACAEIAAEWHGRRNGSLTPQSVRPRSHRKVWWRCSAGHEWQAMVANRTRGRGCPQCSLARRWRKPAPATRRRAATANR